MSGRTEIGATEAASERVHGAVYLLPHLEQRRFKIGWSLQPMVRVAQLPEYEQKVLDLDAAQVAWFPLARRAREAERALHRSLAPYSVRPAHRCDGQTEWFANDGLGVARKILSLMPLGRTGAGEAQLLPLMQAPMQPLEPMLSVWTPPTETAVDAWYRTEDLWTRLRKVLSFAVEADGVSRRIHWLGLRRLVRLDVLLLRANALDLETYGWHEGGHRRSLVQMMDWENDDLVLALTSGPQLRRWTDGDAVDDELRVFMRRYAVQPMQARRPGARASR